MRRYLDESSKDAIIGVLRDELISKQVIKIQRNILLIISLDANFSGNGKYR